MFFCPLSHLERVLVIFLEYSVKNLSTECTHIAQSSALMVVISMAAKLAISLRANGDFLCNEIAQKSSLLRNHRADWCTQRLKRIKKAESFQNFNLSAGSPKGLPFNTTSFSCKEAEARLVLEARSLEISMTESR